MPTDTTPNYVDTFDRHWRHLVTDEKGALVLDAVQRELHDFSTVLGEVPKAYVAVTDGNISKPNTRAEHVITFAEEATARRVREGIADALTELVEELDANLPADEILQHLRDRLVVAQAEAHL